MPRFRSILFWIHLAAGLVCGVIIFIMSFTGIALAFESELVAWSQRDARTLTRSEMVQRPADELLQAFAEKNPDLQPTALTLSSNPFDAPVIHLGRRETHPFNPADGSIREPASHAMENFMRTMVSWHRWLAREGDSRATGKAITGVSNTAFLVLAITGLYLWFPRKWAARAFRPALWFNGSAGKARDWNWHNVFGFWMLIPIAVMSATGTVISYRWAGDLVYRIAGEEPPVRRGPPGPPTSPSAAPTVVAGVGDPGPTASPTTESIPLDTFFTLAAADQPDWSTLSLRLPVVGTTTEVTVKTPHDWPRTASTTLTIDAAAGLGTAAIIDRQTFADQSPGRQARIWMRFLHTGQALGWWGQLLGAIGCLAGCFLVYTGFALSYRRFFGRPAKVATTPTH